ncbi:MAG: hypothetical protein JWN72_101 [Thermoleophilia bacterium]|nr:hypothetical protein [Thermoleophilia bacterium]
MSGAEAIGIAASTWGVGMAVSPALQIRAMLREDDAEPISIGYFSVLLVGFFLWVAYGVVQHSWVLIIPNAISAVFGIGVIATALHVKRRQRDAS